LQQPVQRQPPVLLPALVLEQKLTWRLLPAVVCGL